MSISLLESPESAHIEVPRSADRSQIRGRTHYKEEIKHPQQVAKEGIELCLAAWKEKVRSNSDCNKGGGAYTRGRGVCERGRVKPPDVEGKKSSRGGERRCLGVERG